MSNMILEELKEFSLLHARAQGLKKNYCQSVLNRISEPTGSGKGSWGFEWHEEAQNLLSMGNSKGALRCAVMGRFPYACDAERDLCAQLARQTFRSLRKEYGNFEEVNIKNSHGEFSAYLADPIARRKPSTLKSDSEKSLLLAIGGIVSTKEQWGQFLGLAKTLGTRMVVTEMPGVGDNTILYSSDSYKMLASLMNELNIASNTNIHIIGMSFGGHLALQYSLHDDRVKSITTVGAPIRDFFLAGATACPHLTLDILSYLTGANDDTLTKVLESFILSDEELSFINARINYMSCKFDEIIPATEYNIILEACKYFYGRRVNDIHGAPNEIKATQFWIMRNVALAIRNKRINIISALLQQLFDLKNVMTSYRHNV